MSTSSNSSHAPTGQTLPTDNLDLAAYLTYQGHAPLAVLPPSPGSNLATFVFPFTTEIAVERAVFDAAKLNSALSVDVHAYNQCRHDLLRNAKRASQNGGVR